MRLRATVLALLLALAARAASAHELQSVVLWLDEQPGEVIAATLKSPLTRDGSPATILPRLPQACRAVGPVRVVREERVVVREWRQACPGGLDGLHLRIDGLDPRAPEAVVVARFADGRERTFSVDRHDPATVIDAAGARSGAPLWAYLPIGIEHILLGADHLLFVFGLLLVVAAGGHGLRMLVASLTAFTAAHSLTLACAALGAWGLPSRPVEVLIAVSILMLALELARHAGDGSPGQAPTLTLRQPWLAAFAFGLLHGFGFAGALADIGLPENARAWALLLFNAGVEVGQLLFVGALLAAWMVLRRAPNLAARATPAVVTVLGAVAAYWVLDRAAAWVSLT